MANPFVPERHDPLGPGTLGRRLVVRTTLLVVLSTVVLGAFFILSSFQILQNELDARLVSSLARGGGMNPAEKFPTNEGTPLSIFTPRNSDQLFVYPSTVSDAARNAVLDACAKSSGPMSLQVEGLGLYRVYCQLQPQVNVVGLPYSEVVNPLRSQGVFILMFIAAVSLGAFMGARSIVTNSLRPLNRLADTASAVAKLPLATGSGQVPVRVAEDDLDERSETGRVGLAFNRMLDHVEHALAARHRSETKVRQFVADASHELRNPLAAIRGYAELTRRGREQLPEDTAHALERIDSESERMGALVEDLLLLARLDNQPVVESRPVDLTQVVLNAVSDARVAGPEHRWTLDVPDGEVVVLGDAFRLHQVVANLLGNARVHTPPGTHVEARLRVEQASSLAPARAVVEVCDDGPGVPEQIRDSVFERFTRADASRVRQGQGSSTGLGLAIVAAVTQAHGGQVSLDSSPGRTCFRVELPLPPSPTPVVPAAQA
ncbi:MAG: HAMP domain-containing histidine kinase [Propionibacteriaceae bacterium]|jgi:two-component system OmpR family sensor kinase|nr:HAMP domain-containing histidine kinase [Propionibacteriaceae bacterium]